MARAKPVSHRVQRVETTRPVQELLHRLRPRAVRNSLKAGIAPAFFLRLKGFEGEPQAAAYTPAIHSPIHAARLRQQP
jgi:hypothetical protein